MVHHWDTHNHLCQLHPCQIPAGERGPLAGGDPRSQVCRLLESQGEASPVEEAPDVAKWEEKGPEGTCVTEGGISGAGAT